VTEAEEKIRVEQFAHAVAFGAPLPHALRQAGYQDTTVAFAFSLMQRQDVQDFIQKDREWLREKYALSLEQIAVQLDNDRAFAYSCENPSAAVAATMSKAKIYGLGDPERTKGMPRKITIEWNDGDEPEEKERVA
jgi:hypothetical protein